MPNMNPKKAKIEQSGEVSVGRSWSSRRLLILNILIDHWKVAK